LPKYQKKKARVSHLFFETNLEKNILTPDNKLFSATKKRKTKNTTKKKSSAKLYSLSSQPVRKNDTKSKFIFNVSVQKIEKNIEGDSRKKIKSINNYSSLQILY